MTEVLRRLGYRRLSVRPQHPAQDAEAVEAHKKNFAELVAAATPETARDKPIELWWQDEARVGQRGTLTRCWARKGTRPRRSKDTRYNWAYIFGAVCPARGVGAALVLPTANADMMSRHLAELSTNVQPGHHAGVTTVIRIFIAGRDHQRAKGDHVGQCVLDTAGIARIVQVRGESVGQPAASLNFTQHQKAAARGDAPAVKPGDDILVENR